MPPVEQTDSCHVLALRQVSHVVSELKRQVLYDVCACLTVWLPWKQRQYFLLDIQYTSDIIN